MTQWALDFDAKQAKQVALRQVAENSGSWIKDFLEGVAKMARANDGLLVTGEKLRMMIEPVVGAPHHHNAWGAAISLAVKKGYAEATGEYAAMRGPKSHARKTPVYRLRAK